MNKMSVLVIGNGFRGRSHARIFSTIAKLVAVCDVNF